MPAAETVTRRTAPAPSRLWPAIAGFLIAFLRVAFDPYRPEAHYMRGPGPACAAKKRRTG